MVKKWKMFKETPKDQGWGLPGKRWGRSGLSEQRSPGQSLPEAVYTGLLSHFIWGTGCYSVKGTLACAVTPVSFKLLGKWRICQRILLFPGTEPSD